MGGEEDPHATRALRIAETTGRPAGNAEWVREIELRSGRSLAPKERGPKAKEKADAAGELH